MATLEQQVLRKANSLVIGLCAIGYFPVFHLFHFILFPLCLAFFFHLFVFRLSIFVIWVYPFCDVGVAWLSFHLSAFSTASFVPRVVCSVCRYAAYKARQPYISYLVATRQSLIISRELVQTNLTHLEQSIAVCTKFFSMTRASEPTCSIHAHAPLCNGKRAS
jgi:hypothetical protein